MTDYKALCAELMREWDAANGDHDLLGVADVMDRARAALAEPVPEGPSDEELVQLAFREKLGRLDSNGNIITRYYYPMDIGENVIDFARAVLDRWGHLAPQPVPPGNGEVAELVEWLHGQDGGIARRAIYSRIADLLSRLVPQPVPEGPSDKEIEGVARLIYRAMQDATAQLTPDWTERGNSGMQDTARGAARAVFARWGQ